VGISKIILFPISSNRDKTLEMSLTEIILKSIENKV
jgi:hypothetical protein